MKVTRHNYEEYFVLYMDNELNSGDRELLEQFVSDNPDLREELDWLLQSRLIPDNHVVFENKEQLIKISDTCSINTTNYLEWLLLYIDNELSAREKYSVENFLDAHPAIKKELEILQKTISDADQEITFVNKEILYRKAEKVHSLSFNWRKIAVAASLLAAISTAAFIIIMKYDNPAEIASLKTPSLKLTQDNPVEKKEIETSTAAGLKETEIKNDPLTEKIIENIDPTTTRGEKTILPKETKHIPLISPNENNSSDEIAGKEQKKTNDLPKPKYNPNVNMNGEINNPVAKVDIPGKGSLTIPKETNNLSSVTPNNSQSLDYVITAASKEPVYLTEDEEQSGRKNKLRGIFRKITRTFEKTTNIKATDDEDRLLLGGLAIRL
ncbi:MAG: anti-sigma factor family protein [Chitinophagaceae bacterium]